jgi:gamma-glutamyltranspeptidase/glutathione hydrolase
MRRAAASASLPLAADAANAVLARGNAVDAVLAGVLAVCGAHPSVLLGPLQVLVGGAGLGLRAIDGRVRQPGKGTQRPRGFLPDEEIPRAARVGVPALPGALAAALASFGKLTAAAVFAAGLDAARGVPERKGVLERLARRGPQALAEQAIAQELVGAAGRLAGGVLTESDLGDVRPTTEPCAVEVVGDRRVATVPWAGSNERPVHAVAAADGRGALAVACFEIADEGVTIPGLGLVAPLLAEPVLRGTTRVRPGEARPAPAPIALGAKDAVDLAVAVAEAAEGARHLTELLRAVGAGSRPEAAARELAAGHAIGVVVARRDAPVAFDISKAMQNQSFTP